MLRYFYPYRSQEAYQLYRDNMYAVAVSAFAFAGMVGAFTVGPVVNKFGRLVMVIEALWIKQA